MPPSVGLSTRRASRRLARLVPVLATVLALAVAVVHLALWAPSERRHTLQRQSNELEALVDVRTTALSHWTQGAIRDAQVLATYPTAHALLSGRVSGPLPYPEEAGAKRHLADLLHAWLETHRYQNALVTDVDGALEAGTATALPPGADSVIASVVHSPRPMACIVPAGQRPLVVVAAPIVDGDTVLGAVLLEQAANVMLAPMLTVHHQANATPHLELRVPTGDHALRVVCRSSGDCRIDSGATPQEGAATETEAVEAQSPVQGTDWTLHARVDVEPVLTIWRARTRERALLVLLLAFGLGASLSALWWSQRSAADRALAESERRARTLVEHTPDAIGVMEGRTGRLVEVNPRMETLLGRSSAALLGMTAAELSPPTQPDGSSSIDRSRELLARALDGERPVFEWTLKRSDGTPVMTQVHLSRLPPENAELVCASVVDISERQRAERDLRRSEEKYRTLVNAIQDGVFIIQDGLMVFVNEPFAAMIGYSVEEVLGQPFLDFVAPEDRALVTDRYRRRQAGERIVSEYELRMLHRNGLTRVYVNMTVDLTELRGTTATIGTLKDFTERRAAEELVRASERRYRLLFERNLAGVYRARPDGQLIDCNSAFALMLGYPSPEEAIDRWQIDTHRNDTELFLGTLDAEREVRDHETTMRRVDGSEVHLLENAIWMAEETQADPTILGTVIDITERRRIEDELHQAQKLQAIGRLAGGVAHDFSNLLQAILATTETLDRAAMSPQTVHAAVQELRSDVERGNDLARQLLLFARRGSSDLVHIELNEAIHASLKLLRRVIRANVRLHVEPCPTPLTVRADPGQLEQVLVNLVLNASDAMPAGGSIEIRSGATDCDAWIDVSDSGPGVPAEIRTRVFEPFFTTKESSEGTGLGLSVAHGIVARHGGSLTIVHTDPGGTTFRVTLPRSDAPAEPAPAQRPREDSVPGRGEWILLVEDEPATRAGIERLLISLGFQVTAVSTAEAALAMPEEHAHDMLLTDLLLPGVDGLTLAEQLAERWPGLPVILMSGYSQIDPPADVPFLHKPFTTAQLAEVLRTVLAHPTTVAPGEALHRPRPS